jgi:hypothetical protein
MDEYYEQLVRGGIAPRRARRLLTEFDDHRADIVRERLELGESERDAQAAADERLGRVQDFVIRNLARPELKSFSARRPWAAFAVAPLLAFAASLLAAGAAIYFLLGFYSHVAPWNAASRSSQTVAAAATLFILWIAPFVAAASVAIMAVGRRRTLIWPIIGIALISFLASLINFQITLPVGHVQGSIGGGIGISSDPAKLASILAFTAARAAPVLALLMWLHSRRAQTAVE